MRTAPLWADGLSLGGANLALYVGAASIKRKRRLLDGICPEALELLKDKHTTTNVCRSRSQSSCSQ
jgi:hypothetical protein